MKDDAELLRCYTDEASEEAFTKLVQRYVDLVYSAAWRQVGGDAHRAKDVTQVVFIALARKAAALRHRPALAGWLYISTRLAAMEVMRAERRRQTREQEIHIMNEFLSTDATSAVDWDKVRPVLDDAMSQLSTRDRELLLLRFFAQRPFREIGTSFGLSEDATRMRVERALGKLRELLIRRGVTSTTVALAATLVNNTVAAAPMGLSAQATAAALTQTIATTGASAMLAGAIQLMTTTKMVVSAVVIVGTLAVGTVLYEHQHTQATDLAARAMEEDNRRLAAKRQEQEQAMLQAERNRADLQARLAELRAQSAKPKSHADETQAMFEAENRQANERGRRFLLAHPEMRPTVEALLKVGVTESNRGFYQQLGFNREKIERFETLILELGRYSTAISPSGIDVGFNLASQEIPKAEQDARLRAFLGDADYARYLDYGRNQAARRQASDLAGALYYTTEPLTAEQMGKMEQILTANIIPNPSRQMPPTFDWSKIKDAATSVLSPRQLEPLGNLQVKSDYMTAVFQAHVDARVTAWKQVSAAK
jgi:RNA polymerase sigma factor (sigma-70 family)